MIGLVEVASSRRFAVGDKVRTVAGWGRATYSGTVLQETKWLANPHVGPAYKVAIDGHGTAFLHDDELGHA